MGPPGSLNERICSAKLRLNQKATSRGQEGRTWCRGCRFSSLGLGSQNHRVLELEGTSEERAEGFLIPINASVFSSVGDFQCIPCLACFT